MNLDNFVYNKEYNGLCLFCGQQTEYTGNSSELGARVICLDEYQCHNCNEFFSTVKVDQLTKIRYFIFTLLEENSEVVIDLKNKEIAVNKSANNISEIHFSNLYWMPYFNLDFSDKKKLQNKIKTYCLLS